MVPLRMLRPVWLLAGFLATGALGLRADETVPAPTVTQPAERPTLTAAQTDQLALLAAEELSRPAPKPRPRLKEGDVLSEEGRLRTHGGVSLTVGASSTGSFYGTSGWVGFHDPVTGLSVSFSYSSYKGDGLGGYYPGYGYPMFYPGVGPISEATPEVRAMPFMAGERGGRR